jgi:predicted RNA binding protein YcfA (HicA-like mRNA interferase family)
VVARAEVDWRKVHDAVRFSELVRMLESYGFRLLKEKGSVRYYRKPGHDKLIRVDYHGSKEVPAGTCHAMLKAAGIKPGVNDD